METGHPPAAAVAALISEHYVRLSDGHRRVADLILTNPHQSALMTLEQMSEASGVSKATVNRLGHQLGLSSYLELKRLLRNELEDSLRPVDSLVDALRPDERAAPWTRSLIDDIERIRTIEPVGGDAAFARASDLLATARRVFLVGFGGSAYFAHYAAFCLSSLRDGCEAVSDSGGFEAASRKILGAGPGDAALQLGFARYTRDGIQIATRLHAQDVPLICITDSPASPFSKLAAISFLVARKPGFVLSGSGTGGVAVIEALLRGTAAMLGNARVGIRSARLTSALGDAVVTDDNAGGIE